MKKPLSSLDLNLLLCLQLLTQELSVTRTAKRMNVSPSAVSKSLDKLRAGFDDSLDDVLHGLGHKCNNDNPKIVWLRETLRQLIPVILQVAGVLAALVHPNHLPE